MGAIHKPGTDWTTIYARCQAEAPEAFSSESLLNIWGGQWHQVGSGAPLTSGVDGTQLGTFPRLSHDEAITATRITVDVHNTWRHTPLAERKSRVSAAVAAMREHRDLLALLLMWEIGKPWRLACADVDRALDGVSWYLDEIDVHMAGRAPLDGPVSNIASWNYPMSVLMHSMLVQVLAGNAVIAKTPTDGGGHCLTLATALAVREGLPISLVSGSGPELSEALVQQRDIGCVAFVGGRGAGYDVSQRLADLPKRYMLEQEGLNSWGIWNFSQWDLLAGHIRKGFEYGKQRCTAYPRYVVQRDLVDDFLEIYLPVLKEIKVGNPFVVQDAADQLPELDFGPLINARKIVDLDVKIQESLDKGAIPIYRGKLDDERFLPGQDRSAYIAPVSLLAPPPSSWLYHAEPFGPIDSIVVVDTEAQLLAGMNVSNGSLVASLACDDERLAQKLSAEIMSFKVGVNKPRSRGDRDEVFGGYGASWKGAFVGGPLLVHAVTQGETDDRLYGNFPSYTLSPTV
jgi:acyl-CoA reductase-like NAD-dependent aldehyde dehydrogenase